MKKYNFDVLNKSELIKILEELASKESKFSWDVRNAIDHGFEIEKEFESITNIDNLVQKYKAYVKFHERQVRVSQLKKDTEAIEFNLEQLKFARLVVKRMSANEIAMREAGY